MECLGCHRGRVGGGFRHRRRTVAGHAVMSRREAASLADQHKAQARMAGISQRRATLLSNIARSFSALATQLDMLADDAAENSRRGQS